MENQENQPKDQKIHPAAWVVLVAGIALLAVGAYYFLTQVDESASNVNAVIVTNTEVNENVNTVANANTTSNTNEVANANTEVDTSDWLTYENEEYGYIIQYPENYRIEEGDIYINIFSNSVNDDSTVTANELKVVVSINENVEIELDDWIETFNIDISEEEVISINQRIAKVIVGTTNQMGSIFTERHIFYKIDSKGIVITAIPFNSELLSVFDRIAKSFKVDK